MSIENEHSRRALYTAEQVRELDRLAVAGGITGFELMQRAGHGLLKVLLEHWPGLHRLLVLTGPGNNGGDGYVLAALARQQGLVVTLIELADPGRVQGDALEARSLAQEAGVPLLSWSESTLSAAFDESARERTVVVDAMLGTGTRGALRYPYDRAIALLNDSGLPVLAADVPSGLESDTGAVGSDAVLARITVTFIGRKQGLYTGRGPRHCGDIVFDDLGAGDAIAEGGEPGRSLTPSARCLDIQAALPLLPPRPRDAHKGHCGHVLVIGGDRGYGGAALMAAEAAARSGAGLTSLVTRGEHVPPSLARQPEVMVRALDSSDPQTVRALLEPLLARADVVLLGPGLGRDEWGRVLFGQVLDWHENHPVPLVMDADALNLLAGEPDRAARESWILTPHPGEAARLLGWSPGQVEADRFAALRELQEGRGGVCLLKGAGTLISGGEGSMDVCTEGNPGMASGGMGDVLGGIVASLAAQGLKPADAVRCGVCVHGESADRAAQQGGQRGLLATDLLPLLRRILAGG